MSPGRKNPGRNCLLQFGLEEVTQACIMCSITEFATWAERGKMEEFAAKGRLLMDRIRWSLNTFNIAISLQPLAMESGSAAGKLFQEAACARRCR